MKTTKTIINGMELVEIENFISNEEVNALIQEIEFKFQKSNTNYPEYYRNNERIETTNTVLSQKLFHLIDQNLLDELILGVNSKIRYCKYSPNQEFTVHQDGIHYLSDYSESKYTFLLYLNDDFLGGETLFFNTKTDKVPLKSIHPKKGTLIIFDHRIWHSGKKVLKGNKYILRSDLYVTSKNQNNHHKGYIWSLLQLENNNFFSCGRDRSIKQWNSQLELINSFTIHEKSVIKVAQLSSDEFVSCSRDFTLKKWNKNGLLLSSIQLESMALNIAIYNGDIIVTTNTSGYINFYTLNLKLIHSFQIHNAWIWGLEIDDNQIITCCEKGEIIVTDYNSLNSTLIHQHKTGLFCLKLSQENLFIGSQNGELITLNRNTNLIKINKIHKDIIRQVEVETDFIYSCSEDCTIKKTAINTGRSINILIHSNFIQDIFILNKTQIISAGFDGMIRKTDVL